MRQQYRRFTEQHQRVRTEVETQYRLIDTLSGELANAYMAVEVAEERRQSARRSFRHSFRGERSSSLGALGGEQRLGRSSARESSGDRRMSDQERGGFDDFYRSTGLNADGVQDIGRPFGRARGRTLWEEEEDEEEGFEMTERGLEGRLEGILGGEEDSASHRESEPRVSPWRAAAMRDEAEGSPGLRPAAGWSPGPADLSAFRGQMGEPAPGPGA